MPSTLNTELLAGMLRSKRADKALRTVAQEIGGVSFATLSRVEQGKVPDVDTFIRICKWLQVSSDTFIVSSSQGQPSSSRDQVAYHLRADKVLPPDLADAILRMIDYAYTNK